MRSSTVVDIPSGSTRHGARLILASALSLVIGLAGCSSTDDSPPDPPAASPTAASSASAAPAAATSAPVATGAAAPTPKPPPTPPANPLEGFSGAYTYVETVTSSYYSTKDVGDQHKGAWTVTTDCTKKCVSTVSQKLKDEDQTFTLTGKSSRFTGDSGGGATCIAANGKATGQKIKAVYIWDLKADKAANGEIKALNGRKTFEILQNCKKQKTKGFKITYQVSLRLRG